MNYIEIEKHLLVKSEAVKEFPFGPETAVFKVCKKMFALLTKRNGVWCVNLKSEPSEASALRCEYPTIVPGYHMNKDHWNTITLDDSLSNKLFDYLIDESYRLVVCGLKKSDRVRLLNI